jgi:hypothetical protein
MMWCYYLADAVGPVPYSTATFEEFHQRVAPRHPTWRRAASRRSRITWLAYRDISDPHLGIKIQHVIRRRTCRTTGRPTLQAARQHFTMRAAICVLLQTAYASISGLSVTVIIVPDAPHEATIVLSFACPLQTIGPPDAQGWFEF